MDWQLYLRRNLFEDLPPNYIEFIDAGDAFDRYNNPKTTPAEKGKLADVVNAYTYIEDFDIYRYELLLDYIENEINGHVINEMHSLGYSAATIWFYDKSEEDLIEALNLLETDFVDILNSPKPLSMRRRILMDFFDERHCLYKISTLFHIAETHSDGCVYYLRKRNLDNLRENLMSIRDGILRYIYLKISIGQYQEPEQ
ncbi:MAG: hypothetical protein ABI721_05545 [Candidatus Dojkabacteria bacterium]